MFALVNNLTNQHYAAMAASALSAPFPGHPRCIRVALSAFVNERVHLSPEMAHRIDMAFWGFTR